MRMRRHRGVLLVSCLYAWAVACPFRASAAREIAAVNLRDEADPFSLADSDADHVALAAGHVSVVSYSGSNTWTGLGHTNLWSVGANWSAGVPGNGQVVIVDAGSLRLTEATARLDALVLGADATLTVAGWESVIRADEITVAGTITHAAQTVSEPDPDTGEWIPQHRIWLQGSNLIVTTTGSLNADYKGYRHGAGPGRAVQGGGFGSGGGGGYGGQGGDGYHAQKHGLPYGDPSDPWQPGSGGGLYGAADGVAGGAIRIEMSGRVTIDGTVTARGQNGSDLHATAASGGGIAIICDTFQGAATGLVRVDGGRGNYYGGNGGGGRIAIHFNPITQKTLANPHSAVRFSAHAWKTATRGHEFTMKSQMGTLYMTDMTLLADSLTAPVTVADQRFWYTRLHLGTDFTHWAPESMVISNCVMGLPVGFTLAVGEDLTLVGLEAPLVGEDSIRAGLTLYAVATNQLYGSHLTVGRDLTIGSNTWLYPHTEGTSAAVVGMRVRRDVTVAAGGGIDADEKGYMLQSGNANGTGAGVNNDSGGSYGGLGGGSKVGQTYGLAALPLEPGSPGGWRSHGGGWTETGKGGGAIHLLAGGTLTLDGLLTANGGCGWYYCGPAGSGGAIFLSGRHIFGHGRLQANGGAGESSRAPGGGGRIAVWHHMPLAIAEQRIAARDLSGMLSCGSAPFFTGELQATAYTSVLANQPKAGTTGFYILGTLVIVR